MYYSHTCRRFTNFRKWPFLDIYGKMKEKFEVGSFGENDAMYLGMRVIKQNSEVFDGIVLDSNGMKTK